MRGLAQTVLAILVASACSSDPPAAAPGPKDGGGAADPDGGGEEPLASDKVNATTETLEVGGVAREYALAVPKDLTDRVYPLVLVFHGDGGSGPGMRAAHTFDAASGDEAIVAYPTGLDRGWDIYTPSATNQDIAFVEALVEALASKYRIDLGYVFGVGYSSGAFFINKVACRNSAFFRGIVSHAGGAPDEPDDPDATAWPNGFTKCKGQSDGVAAMVVHGAEDTTVTVDGGEFTAVYWSALDGCAETRSSTTPAPCMKYDGCPAGKTVLFCLIPGLGHVVWDRGAEEGWAFMQSL